MCRGRPDDFPDQIGTREEFGRQAVRLLRYADYVVPLGDRLRLLAALDEHGSMPLAECLKAFRETNAVPGIAVLILHGYVEVELDDAPIGPETSVRRITR